MELKELLGEELYKQVQAKIDEKNSAETDKLKHVRYTDLSEGKYVSKEKYDSELEKLNGLITGKDTEIGNANKLIEELKKASKGDEGMQQKISTYETENASSGAATAGHVVKKGLSRTIAKESSATTGLTDVYAVKFDVNDGFHGISLNGGSVIDQYLPNFNEPGTVKDAEVEMIAATVLKNTQHAGVLRNIKIA